MATLCAKILFGTPEEMQDIQRVLEEAPTYSLRISGAPPPANDAETLFSELPPGKPYSDKFVLGFYEEGRMIGCADIIRSFPIKKKAMIGLLLLSESRQARGLGAQAYSEVEKLCLSWPEIEIARIGVVQTNAAVLPFWQKAGFVDTGIRRPFVYGSIQSETIVLEKKIRLSH